MAGRVAGTLRGFKDFLLRGNVIDLAVAVVIGAAFTAVVNALAINLFGSLIAALVGQRDLSGVGFTLNGTVVQVGPFLAALVNFVIVSAIVYFLVLVPVTRLVQRRADGDEPPTRTTPEDVALLREIRDLLQAGALPHRRGTDPAAPQR